MQGPGRDKEACQNMCGCSNSVQTKQTCLAEVLNEAMRVIHMHHFTVPRRWVHTSSLWLPSNLSFCCCVSVRPQITTQKCLVLEELWGSLLMYDIIQRIALLLAYLRQELFFPSWCSGWPIYAKVFPQPIRMSETWISLIMLNCLLNITGQTWPSTYGLHWSVESCGEGVTYVVKPRVLEPQAWQAVYVCACVWLHTGSVLKEPRSLNLLLQPPEAMMT